MTLGASWKTTASGIVTVAAGFVQFAHQAPMNIAMPPLLLAAAQYMMLGGIGAGLLFAKDNDVTGGDRPQTGMVAVADPVAAAKVAEVVLAPAPSATPIANVAPARPAHPVVAAPNAIRW